MNKSIIKRKFNFCGNRIFFNHGSLSYNSFFFKFHKKFESINLNLFQNRSVFSSSSWSRLKKENVTTDKMHRSHFERRLIQTSPENVYSVVANVEQYKYFVPYVKESKILRGNIKEGEMEAELVVGFGPVEERYTSLVKLLPKKIDVSVTSSNLFHYLNNSWEFEPGPYSNTCWTSFEVTFKFRSQIHRTLTDLFFNGVQKKMLEAFQERCKEIYG